MLVLIFKIKIEIVEIFCNTESVTTAIVKEGDLITTGLSQQFQPHKENNEKL